MNSAEKIIDTFLDNLSEMGARDNSGGEQMRGSEPFVDEVHISVPEDSIHVVDRMGSFGKDNGFVKESALEEMSHSCGGDSSIPVYDKTPTNSTNEHMVQFEPLLGMPFQLSSVRSSMPVFDMTPEDDHTIFDMTPEDIIPKYVLANNNMGIEIREEVTAGVNNNASIEGANFHPVVDTNPKFHQKGRKRTFLTPEEAKKQGSKYLHPSFYSQSIARTKKPRSCVINKK